MRRFYPIFWTTLSTMVVFFGGTSAAQTIQPPAKIVSTNLTGFTVPFKVNNSDGSLIEVQLYVSSDQGKSWSYYDKKSTRESGFPFRVQGDGEYWFALKTLDRNRRLLPSGNIVKPELGIIVDSQKPTLQFEVNTDAAGRIVSSWDIKDQAIDPKSLTLQHRDVTNAIAPGQWLPVKLSSAPSAIGPLKTTTDRIYDSVAWWPKTTARRVEIQIRIADAAGNSTTLSRFVNFPINVKRSNSNSTISNNQWKQRITQPPTSSTPAGLASKTRPNLFSNVAKPVNASPAKKQFHKIVNHDQSNNRVGSPVEYVAPPAPTPLNRNSSNGFVTVDRVETNQSSPSAKIPNNDKTADSTVRWPSKPVNSYSSKAKKTRATTLISKPSPGNLGGTNTLKVAGVPDQHFPVSNFIGSLDQERRNASVSNGRQSSIASSRVPPLPTADGDANRHLTRVASGESPQVARAQPLPANSHSSAAAHNLNTFRFSLNYGIKAIDNSGVGTVVLWATKDGGNTWNSWATDPDNTSPFPVAVESEGVYGFRITVNSKDGLIGKAPESGDAPDIVVNVDATTPKIAITSAPYGTGNDVGKLILHWSASDLQLAARPIELYYSPTANGPWTEIAKGLRNTGSFAWKPPAHITEEIYLKAHATDVAGNIGTFELTQPVNISGLIPRGQILGLEPIR